MSVTLKEIARQFGVSASTVSKALNDKPGVSEELRQKILEAVERPGLRPKHKNAASASVKDAPAAVNVNLLVRINRSVEADPFYSLITEGISRELQANRCNLLYYVMHERELDEAAFGEMFGANHIGGAILVGADFGSKLLDRLAGSDLPSVLVDNKHPAFSSVNTDNFTGAVDAVDHLVELGHRDIVFLSGPLEHRSIRQRYDGYLEGMRRGAPDAEPTLILCEGVSVDDGYEALRGREGRCTAVFAANDKLAIGAMKALKEQGLRVPEDVSIVGFDDIEWGLHTEPPLTTIRIAKHQTGALAAQLLLFFLNGGDNHLADVTVSTKLVRRQSTAALTGKPRSGA